ncbi:MAG: amidase [Alphaproteobacteria bacterium]|nr:amidase [Alphaproteobacteria bacterium]
MADWHGRTALELGQAIGAGALDPVALAEHYFDRIARLDPDHAIYVRLTRERALAEAEAARARATSGARLGPLDGVTLSWKDLYDTAGTVTTAGSKLLADRVPARDAAVLARATRAGLVCLGKTNMTEFAFSGLGINPTYGTPANPFDAATPRVPGGSSSGAAVSVARGLAAAGIGSDTGGSVRIPAAWNGLVGLKTSHGILPLDGVLPLSPSLDTVGPITRDVADANALFGVLAGRPSCDLGGATLVGTRLVVPTDHFFERTEAGVRATFEAAVEALAKAGATIVREPAPEVLAGRALIGKHGVLAGIEAYACWHDLIATNPNVVFHMVRERIAPGGKPSGADLIALKDGLARLSAAFARRLAGCDAMIAPTVAVDPPAIAPLLASDQAYLDANSLSLFNTAPGNWLGCVAVSVPCGGAKLPVGLMFMQRGGFEGQLLRLAAAAEKALAGIAKPVPV